MSKIRPVLLHDLPIVAQIESEIHTHPWTQNMFNDCFKRESADLGYVGFVLEKSNRIIAYLISQIILDECHILTIGVEKEYQNQGYATQLLDYLFQYLQSNDCKRILLEVRESNQSAICLYTKLGFQCIAQRKNYYVTSNNLHENALVLEKKNKALFLDLSTNNLSTLRGEAMTIAESWVEEGIEIGFEKELKRESKRE